MGLHSAAGRRRRRLIVALLALTLGATLGIAAPQAFAGSNGAEHRYQPSMTLKVSPTSSKLRKLIRVTGEVWPVEMVGESVRLTVQRKSSSGRWTAVTSARRPVLLHANPRKGPPTSWEGAYSATVTPNVGEYGISSYNWTGQVVFELDHVEDGWLLNPQAHVAVYFLISATGAFSNDWSWTDPSTGVTTSRTSVWDDTPPDPTGALFYYFADSVVAGEFIPAQSYDASVLLKFYGVSTTTFGVGTPIVYGPPFGASIVDLWWEPKLAETRPLAAPAEGRMTAHRERPWPATQSDSPNTETLDWNLAAFSAPDRNGYYNWTYTPTKKGIYRIRATIAKTADHSALQEHWRQFTVK